MLTRLTIDGVSHGWARTLVIRAASRTMVNSGGPASARRSGRVRTRARRRFGKVYGPAVVANVGPRCEILGKAAEMA